MTALQGSTKDRLGVAGWQAGDAAESLELTPDEAAFVKLEVAIGLWSNVGA